MGMGQGWYQGRTARLWTAAAGMQQHWLRWPRPATCPSRLMLPTCLLTLQFVAMQWEQLHI